MSQAWPRDFATLLLFDVSWLSHGGIVASLLCVQFSPRRRASMPYRRRSIGSFFTIQLVIGLVLLNHLRRGDLLRTQNSGGLALN